MNTSLRDNPYEHYKELMGEMAQHDEEIRAVATKLNKGELKLTDKTITFAAFADASGMLKLTPDGLSVKKGIRSLSNNKLGAKDFFMPTDLILLGATLPAGATGTDAELLGATYGHIEDEIDPAAPNGVMLLRNDERIFLNDFSLEAFANKGIVTERRGLYKLKRSYIFKANSPFTIEIEALKATPLAAYKLIMQGISTESA